MGLFRKLGRQVERFTTKAKSSTEEYTVYECDDCGARFSEQHEQCPECKSGDVISLEQRE